MTVRDHTYPIPDQAELAQMVGAATPHFALQIRERVASLLDGLPEGHERRQELLEHMARLDALAIGGEVGSPGQAELPARPPLVTDAGSRGDRGAHDG